MIKEYPVLYKYTQTGAIQQWQIVVENNTYYTIEGHKDGKLTTSLPTICKGKNIGKKNQTSDEEQANLEAAAKMQKKIEKGYNEVLTSKKNFVEPMLAEKLDKDKLDFTKQRVFVQPKLDGLRALNYANHLVSRNGKPYITCPHLYQNQVMLDGELYSHEYKDDFNKIVSLCKKQKPTKEELDESEDKVQFWAYDFPEKVGPFSQRIEALREWHKKFGKIDRQRAYHIKIVPTYEVFNMKDIEKWHETFLELGYEGTIVRLDLGNYEYKRSKQLLKYKDWVDEEFEIIGYEEGTGGRAGTIGKFNMKHDKDRRADFESNVKGDFEYLRLVWRNRDSYIGKMATVKYFNRTPKKEDGTGDKPRFPYIIKIDREEYE